jgi:hypothetical protein
VRIGRDRVVQRRLLNLGELNTTQIDRWQRSIEVIEEDGQARQRRLFSDREGRAPLKEEDVYEVVLSSLAVRRPRRLGDCWLGCRLWEELGLDKFWSQALGDRRGAVEWSKVMELLAVNRLCAPDSELSIHERWFSRTAMDSLLGCDEAVAGKDRLYRALDKALEHRDALMGHLQERWSDLFGAECQILLYDLTSTYFEGEAEGWRAPRAVTPAITARTLCKSSSLWWSPRKASRLPLRFSRGHRRRDHPRRDRRQDRE